MARRIHFDTANDDLHFTSDTHFFHKNILKYCPQRPWESVDEMNEALVENWNSRISPTSVVFHLGDFAFCGSTKMNELLTRLNGKIIHFRGNHDHIKPEVRARFEAEYTYKRVKVKDGDEVFGIAMMHYPMASWEQMQRGTWHLHGHSHGNLNFSLGRMLDVGIDTHPELRPYTFAEIKEHMLARPIESLDHHSEGSN